MVQSSHKLKDSIRSYERYCKTSIKSVRFYHFLTESIFTKMVILYHYYKYNILRMKDVGNIYIHYVHPDDDITIS